MSDMFRGRTVRCSCGHDFNYRINGKTAAQREETIRWLQSKPCPACEKKQSGLKQVNRSTVANEKA
jgi:hypothetical protein